jgi:hypothetical protein
MNYFEYFSEIEERFTRRRGSVLLLSTLDWALIETWREAGVPLAAVLRGIDDAFDKYEARTARAAGGKGRLRKVNGLAWCAQAVMEAAEQMAEAAVGSTPTQPAETRESGFEGERVVRFLHGNAESLSAAPVPEGAAAVCEGTAQRLRDMAAEGANLPLDELDRTLTVLEERLVAALTAAAPEDTLVALRAQADAALAAFRGKMGAVQLRQVREQFMTRKLLAEYRLPRLSLFYMGLAE